MNSLWWNISLTFDREQFPFFNVDNDSLLEILNDTQSKFPLNVIDNLLYNPFKERMDLNTVDRYIANDFKELDCKYYFTDTVNNKVDLSKGLKLLSYNISSIPRHFEAFQDQCLEMIEEKFDVIGLCETRLHDSISSLYSLDLYNGFYKNKGTGGGGVAIYLHENFQGKIIQNVSLQLDHIESLFIEVTGIKSFITGIVYRPPNASCAEFLKSVTDILEFITTRENVPCYVMGDFNLNLLKHYENNVSDFINLMYSYLFIPLIIKPTRVTQTSASIIDHIWTNDLQNYQTSGIIFASISDHFPVFASFKLHESKLQHSETVIKKRIYNSDSINLFKSDLQNYAWEADITGQNVNHDFTIYMEKFLLLYNKHFPVKELKIKERHKGKPYITTAIKNSIKQRNKLQKLYAKWPLTYGERFRKYRNMLTSVIREAKENYRKSMLKENAGNTKGTWKILNDLLGKRQKSGPTSFIFKGESISDSNLIAKGFNDYFSNIGSKLAQDIEEPSIPFHRHLPQPPLFSFYLRPTTRH